MTFRFESRKGPFSIFLRQERACFLIQSTLCNFFPFAELNHFSDCMVFVQTKKYLSYFEALNNFLLYKFMSLRFVDFFVEYLLICPFSANHQKRDLFHFCSLFHFCRQVLNLFFWILLILLFIALLWDIEKKGSKKTEMIRKRSWEYTQFFLLI